MPNASSASHNLSRDGARAETIEADALGYLKSVRYCSLFEDVVNPTACTVL